MCLQIDNDYWFHSDPEVSTTDLWGEQYPLSTYLFNKFSLVEFLDLAMQLEQFDCQSF